MSVLFPLQIWICGLFLSLFPPYCSDSLISTVPVHWFFPLSPPFCLLLNPSLSFLFQLFIVLFNNWNNGGEWRRQERISELDSRTTEIFGTKFLFLCWGFPFSFVSRVFIIAYWSIFYHSSKPLSHNSKTSVVFMVALKFFFHLVWDLPGSWYNKWFPVEPGHFRLLWDSGLQVRFLF